MSCITGKQTHTGNAVSLRENIDNYFLQNGSDLILNDANIEWILMNVSCPNIGNRW